jgi:hypothetical protein
MATATERLVVLMTPEDKSAVENKAAALGLKTAEFVRRAAAAYDPEEAASLVQLAALAADLKRSNQEAGEALDRALASVEETRRQLESHRADRSAA